MTRWILQTKADEPWSMLGLLDSDTYQIFGLRMAKLDNSWAVRVKSGYVQGDRTSKL